MVSPPTKSAEKSTSLLRFSSESTESADQGRSPGSSDFCRPSLPSSGKWLSGAKVLPHVAMGQTYSCGDSSGFAPDSLLIPSSNPNLKVSLRTKIDSKLSDFYSGEKPQNVKNFGKQGKSRLPWQEILPIP